MEGPSEGIPPQDDEAAELQEYAVGRWIVVAKQASCREHPDKKSCLLGRYLTDSVIDVVEIAVGTPYMRSRTPPQGLALAEYTHHPNGGWVKEVTSKRELLLKKLGPLHATYALEDQVVRAGWDKSGRAHVGTLKRDALVLAQASAHGRSHSKLGWELGRRMQQRRARGWRSTARSTTGHTG